MSIPTTVPFHYQKYPDFFLNTKQTSTGQIHNNGLHCNDRHHGFRPGRGTDTTLALLHETVATHNGNGENADLVSRDLSRAFDKVWNDGLRYKLRIARLPDTMTRTFCNYLTDRTATIRIGNYIYKYWDKHLGVSVVYNKVDVFRRRYSIHTLMT